MTSGDIAGFIGNNKFLRRLAFFAIHLTTLREWYIKKTLRDALENKKEFSFLDAGSGLGQHSVWIAEKYPGSQVTGIDSNIDQINECKKFIEKSSILNLKLFAGSLDNLEFNSTFDFVLCASVLEHIENDKQVLKIFYKYLKPNGKLIIYVPLAEKRVLRSLDKKINAMSKQANKKFPHEHVRYYTPNELIGKLMENGFKIITSRITYGKFGRWSYDIVTSVQYSSYFKLIFPLYLILLHPFVLLLMWLDTLVNNKEGNGFLVLAEKVQ